MKLYRTPVEIPVAAARAKGLNVVDLARAMEKEKLSGFKVHELNASSYMKALNHMRNQAAYLSMFGVFRDIRSLLGVDRGEVTLPIGYSLLGADHLSSSYVEQASRTLGNAQGMKK